MRISSNFDTEREALNALVDAFAKRMKAKLLQKHREGYRGWDKPDEFPTEDLWAKLQEHCNPDNFKWCERDPVDIANFAAMIWNRERVT